MCIGRYVWVEWTVADKKNFPQLWLLPEMIGFLQGILSKEHMGVSNSFCSPCKLFISRPSHE